MASLILIDVDEDDGDEDDDGDDADDDIGEGVDSEKPCRTSRASSSSWVASPSAALRMWVLVF